MSRVLIDTGPIVAILSARDNHHAACLAALKELIPPLLTCWPVLTEAQWLLRRSPQAVNSLFVSLRAGLFEVQELRSESSQWIHKFLKKYEQIGAQLADAALCWLAEQENIQSIFTLDRKDFSIYRLRRNRSPEIVPLA